MMVLKTKETKQAQSAIIHEDTCHKKPIDGPHSPSKTQVVGIKVYRRMIPKPKFKIRTNRTQ